MNSILPSRQYLLLIISSSIIYINSSGLAFAQSTGGCDSYAPNTASGASQTVSCTGSITPNATSGVTSTANSTAIGNNVTVGIANGTSLVVDGSTVGIGSAANITNNGNLNTSSFYYGYGMSSGANGRSQAGGSSLLNASDGTIYTGGGYAAGMYVSATNASSAANALTNAGAIETAGIGAAGIRLVSGATSSGVVNSIVNSGTMITHGASAHGIQVSGVGAVTIENTGTIRANGSNAFGIYSAGNITTLTNSQGGSTPLTFSGIAPSNYNVVVTSPSNYGKLDAGNGAISGVMNFGINNTSSLAFDTTYATVLNGVKINNIGNSYGTFTSGGNTYQWALAHRINGSADETDLVILPVVQPTLEALEEALAAQSYLIAPIYLDTQTSLNLMGTALQGLFAMQSAGVINGMGYDCQVFGGNNICVSAGGRFTNVSAYPYNNTSGLIIGAYRFSEQIRFGGYLDQNLSQSTPGGIVQLNNGSPMVGVFGVWSQNIDGTGAEAKVSAGYANKDATLTRPVVGVSEAGAGSTSLTTQGVMGLLRYGFAIGNKTVVSPYIGMRYVAGGMGAYSEGQSNTVSSPLTYNAIDNYTTTALFGFMSSHRLAEKTSLLMSAGVEKDTNANIGNLITTGNGDFNVAMNNNYRSVRPTASLGAFHDLSANERIGISAIYRQEAYQALTSTTVMATYTVGL